MLKCRFSIPAVLAAGLSLSAHAYAHAEEASRPEEACPAGTLGVSRTIEVDTTGGPWFGEDRKSVV